MKSFIKSPQPSLSGFRRVAGLLLALSLSASLGGCKPAQQASRSSETLKRNNDPVTISFWHTFNTEETATLEEVLADFRKAYPNITVQLQQVPFSDALNKYKTVAQAGNAPDVFRAEIAWTPELAAVGYLMSLDAFMDEQYKADFLPKALSYTEYKGHSWAVPQVTDCLAMFYNKKLVPKPPETMDELVSMGQALTHGNQYGFFYRGDPYWFTPFVWAFGGELIDGKSLDVKIADKPAVDALQFLIDLRTKYKIVPPSVDFANDYNNMMIGFKSAQIAMIVNGPWSTADVLDGGEFKAHPENFGITRLPKGPGGWGSPIGGQDYVVSANTKHLFASWDLINFLSRPENQAKFALKNNLLPTRKSTYELPEVKQNTIIQSFKYVLDAANSRPVIPQAGAIFIDLKPAYQAALLGEKTPQQALDQVKAAWQTLLKSE